MNSLNIRDMEVWRRQSTNQSVFLIVVAWELGELNNPLLRQGFAGYEWQATLATKMSKALLNLIPLWQEI